MLILGFAFTLGWFVSALLVLAGLALFATIIRVYIFPDLNARVWQLLCLILIILFVAWCLAGHAMF